MRKKHIRTIIISALILLTAIIAILNVDIEPADRSSHSAMISSPEAEMQKPHAKPADAEKEFYSEKQKTETEKEPSSEKQKTGTEKASPAEVQQTETTKEPPSKEQEAEIQKEPIHEEPTDKNNIPKNAKQSDGQNITDAVTPAEVTASTPQEHFCTIEIRCDTVTDTSKLENQAVAPYIPKNGVILEAYKIRFTPGESVFDILLRATKERNIHMEFRSENVYAGGKYIEGINYLYEMDGGPLSGWMYKVNDRFPNYGCGAFEVKDGDAVVWVYSCDLGADVGDNSTW